MPKKKKKRSKKEGQCYQQRCCEKEEKKKKGNVTAEREREREREREQLEENIGIFVNQEKIHSNQFSLNFGEKTFWWVREDKNT